MKKFLLVAGLAAMVMFVAAPVHAVPIFPTETFNLTSNHITGGDFATLPFGDVVLTDTGANIQVTVNLFNGNEFVNTGAGASQNFLFNATGVANGDLSGTGLTFTGPVASPGLHADGTGFFEFGVVFTGQGTGGANKMPGPITFTVANAEFSDFLANADGNFFAADVILGSLNGANGTSAGATGMVDASTKVPEPAAMLLLGLGLVGLAGVRRMLKN